MSPSIRNAGNLFATTRNAQPGPFGAKSGARLARISGGVLSSWPSQKTQLVARGRTGSGAKSDGRRARSVEMITHRPTTGSLRSSGIAVLARARPVEQRREPSPRWLGLEQHGRDLPRDREADAVALREGICRARGAYAFRDHPRATLPRGERRALRELDAQRVVSRQRAGTCQHEVAEAREAGQRSR